ncbi:MAG TPA: tail fiber domain-containing protein, partial [Verrucomicrobiae bacterium]|nr:tail fiber domain-containing protein [Verrucomicrobiae bacterium]
AFTYQGRLNDGGNAANGTYDLRFTLHNADAGGSPIGPVRTNSPTAVSSGLFTVGLDFGAGIFDGTAYWLEIAVRTNGGGAFVPLNPRQSLTPTPYALTSGNVIGTVSAAQLSGTIGSANVSGTYGYAVTFNNAGNSFNGSGAGLTGLNASELAGGIVPDARLAANVARTTQVWMLGGNAATTPGADFLGTMDNQPLEFRVNGRRALRLEPTNDDAVQSNMVNIVNGSAVNFVAPGVHGATISGGGAGNYNGTAYTNSVAAPLGTIAGGAGNTIQVLSDGSSIGGGSRNRILGAYNAAIAGGVDNTIERGALNAVVAGGQFNLVQTNAFASSIGGGYRNTIQTGASDATLSGGQQNVIQTNAVRSTIAGGYQNTIWADAAYATIGGGWQNDIGVASARSTIAGGDANAIESNAWWGAIGGGFGNTIRSNAWQATIPGGSENAAGGDYSFAGGRRAKANHDGAFVWGDATSADVASTNSNSVTMRAGGGYRLFSNGGATLGVYLAPNGGSWTSISDRNAKENIEPVNARVVLDKVAVLPVSTWNYRSQTNGVRHIGPMAQDFKAAFDVGETDTGITTVDADGVALAAIQGLNDVVKEKDARISALEKQNVSLENRLAALEKLVVDMTANGTGRSR